MIKIQRGGQTNKQTTETENIYNKTNQVAEKRQRESHLQHKRKTKTARYQAAKNNAGVVTVTEKCHNKRSVI